MTDELFGAVRITRNHLMISPSNCTIGYQQFTEFSTREVRKVNLITYLGSNILLQLHEEVEDL